MSKTSPTQRTLAYLRKSGAVAAVVEKWNPHAGVRQDLFGFVDLIYMSKAFQCVVAVQATSGTNHAARRTKVLSIDTARQWLECGQRVEIWSWSPKKRVRGGKAIRYESRVEELTLEDFEE